MTVRCWWGHYFLACMVESTETTTLWSNRTTLIVRSMWGSWRLARIMVRLRLVVSTGTDFFVSTCLFVTQKSCDIANITRPSSWTNKWFAASAAAMAPVAVTGGRRSTIRRAAIIHVRIIRGCSIHIVIRLLIIDRL